MIEEKQHYDIAAIRRQLDAAFDDVGLDAFVLDFYPELFDRFGRGVRRDEKITLLLDYCRRLSKLGELQARLAPAAKGEAAFSSAVDRAPAAIHIDPGNPPISAIRRLLTAAFTPDALRRLLYDLPAFYPVVSRFGPKDSLDDMIAEVIDYCSTRLLWDELLAEVRSANPRQYERFASDLYATREQTYTPVSSLPPPDVLSEPGPLPPGSQVPFPRNPEFADREEQLKELAQALLGPSPRSPTLVWGMVGMGMTQLAIEFAYRYGRYFWGVYWLNGANPIESEVAAYGRTIGTGPWPKEPAALADLTLQAWQQVGPWLVILDSLEDVAVAQEWLPRLALPTTRLLITSRQGDWPEKLGLNRMRLDPFSVADSRAFLRTFLPAKRASDEELDRLAEKVGGLPLALRVAAGYLVQSPKVTVDDYLRMLTQETGQGVMSSFLEVMWEQVKDDQAQGVLLAAAWCAPAQPIPRDLLQKAVELDAHEYGGAVELLVGLSLLTLEQGEPGPAIHPLMAEYVRNRSAGPHVKAPAKALEAVAMALVELSDQALDTSLPAQFGPLRPHVEAVAAWAEQDGLDTAGMLWSNLGAHRRMVADYAGARAAFEQALSIDERTSGPQDPRVASDANNLGGVLRDLGDLAGARKAFERALEIDEKTYGPDHPKAASDLNNLGLVLRDLGDLDAARDAFEKALAIDEQVYGSVHPNVARDVDNLGRVLYNLEDLTGARAAFERALAIDEMAYGPDHPNTARDLSNLGRSLYKMGDMPGAREAFERALRINEKAYGPNHPTVAEARDDLAMAGYDLDGLTEACLGGSCVLFAGSGLSESAGLPGWDAFVEGLRAWAVEQGYIDENQGASLRRSIEAGDSSLAADGIAATLQRRGLQAELNAYLGRIFGDSARQPTEIHHILPGLRFSAALTPNHDRLLEQTFEPSPKVYTPADADPLLETLVKRDFFLLKLRGTLDRPETVMLAPTQYQDALVSNRSLAQFMSSLFVSRTIFFLGASLDEILTYCGGIKFGEAARQHYAIVPVSGSAWEAKAEQLQQRYNIKVLPYQSGELRRALAFVQALAGRVEAKAGARSPAETRRKRSQLKTIRLENIGPFQDFSLDLDTHWTILLGDNGVGKSTILKAIALAICGDDARQYADRLIRIGAQEGQITLETTEGDRYLTKLSRIAEAKLVSLPQRPLEIEGWLALGFPPLRGLGWQRSSGPQAETVVRRLSSADLLPLMTGALDPRTNELKQWIINLDYRIIKGQEKRCRQLFDDFFDTVGRLTVGMKLGKGKVDPNTYQVTIETDDGEVPIELVSQGTQSLLGWVGVLLERMYEMHDKAKQPRDQPALVLIDEIDAHMHPSWQQAMVPLLTEVFPKVQFIGTTHSPLIVGGLPMSQVVRFYRDSQGKVDRLKGVEPDMTMGYADQVLTGSLFGLPTTLDTVTQEKIKEYQALLGKSERTSKEEREFQELHKVLQFRIPPPYETPPERRAEELVEALLTQQVLEAVPGAPADMLKEVQDRVLDRAKKLLADLQRQQEVRA